MYGPSVGNFISCLPLCVQLSRSPEMWTLELQPPPVARSRDLNASLIICLLCYVQLRPEMWASELQRLSVLVMESGSFRNLLACGAARLEHLDLLVSRRGTEGGGGGR